MRFALGGIAPSANPHPPVC